MLKLISILIVFILGLYFTCNYTSKDIIEGFDVTKNSFPNILIQKGKELYLHNSRLVKIPCVNPIKFNNLEEYVEFLDWQRSQNIKCPVLFLQHSYDTQNLPSKNLTAAEILEFRDYAWDKFHTSKKYLNLLEKKIGIKDVKNLNATNKIKLKRKLIGS